jgi:uncharacterized membrane protein
MTIRIYCPACRTPFDVDDSLAGEKGLCPSCGTKFTIRRPDPASGHTQPLGLSSAGSYGGVGPESKPAGLRVAVAVTIMAAFGGALIWAFRAYPAGSKPPHFMEVLGICHPMLLHLPIGMLLGALALDLFTGRGRVNTAAVTGLLWFSLLAASVTAIAGYFLGLKGYANEIFEKHMWLGISVPLATGLALITKLIHDSKPGISSGVYRVPLFLTAATITVAGHFGGEMSHADFHTVKQIQSLFAGTPTVDDDHSKGNSLSVEERTVYQAIIAPIISEKCIVCHGESKQKGNLRMDSLEAMVKSGKSKNPGVVPGKSAESESIRRLLTDDEDDHMPPKEKKQLTADEMEIFKWWIDAGAKGDVKIKDAGIPETLKRKILKLAGGSSSGPSPIPGNAEKVAASQGLGVVPTKD